MKSNKGTLGHVLDGGSKLMQRLTDQLGSVRRSLLVSPVGALELRPRIYVGESRKDGDHDEDRPETNENRN
jgi:hypothetical protein